MILTPIDIEHLPATLDRFAAALGDPLARAAFARIARPEAVERAPDDAARTHHREAIRLAAGLGLGLAGGRPCDGCSWDGHAIRTGTEAYVLLHEIAHFQLAAPRRRCRIDFGLGPGPETGDRASAAADQLLFGLACEREEAMASLLGILWETELGHPALASFLDQNWLEGAGRPGTAEHFEATLARLRRGGFVSAEARPTRWLRQTPDGAR